MHDGPPDLPAAERIAPARVEDAGTVADVIAAAFHTIPPTAWLVPDPTERAAVLPANFRIQVEHALAYGEIHTAGDLAAVAVWFPRDRPLPEPAGYDARLVQACGPWVDRFRALDALFDAHHPDRPHHHLALLAVRPEQQGAGLGSALLRHHHTHLDRHGIPAYLEASCPRSRNLYLRHGYRAHGEPFALPSGAPFWPMWREPDPPRPAAERGQGPSRGRG